MSKKEGSFRRKMYLVILAFFVVTGIFAFAEENAKRGAPEPASERIVHESGGGTPVFTGAPGLRTA